MWVGGIDDYGAGFFVVLWGFLVFFTGFVSLLFFFTGFLWDFGVIGLCGFRRRSCCIVGGRRCRS